MRGEPHEVNVYLVRRRDGWLLIDTGPAAADLFPALEAAGCRVEEIRLIALTHLHPDHTGNAERLRQMSGAPVWMHAEDTLLLHEITATTRRRDQFVRALAEGGVEAPLAAPVLESYERLARSFTPLRPDGELTGGQRLESEIGPLEVIWTPGHSPGHVCFYAAEARLLFAGDHLIEDVTPYVAWLPGRDSLGEYLDTLPRLAALDIGLVLSAHGAPWTGHREWLERTRVRHAARAQSIAEALMERPRTPAELVASLWSRDLKPIEYQMAFAQVMAHLEHRRRITELS